MFEFIGIEFSVYGVVSDIKGFEFPFLVMSGFEPGHHRVVVGLLDHVLISPFVVFSFINAERFVIGSRGVVEIIQLKSVIVVSAVFLNTKYFRFSKASDLTLISFVIEKVEWSSSELMGFQIQNCDTWNGAFSFI